MPPGSTPDWEIGTRPVFDRPEGAIVLAAILLGLWWFIVPGRPLPRRRRRWLKSLRLGVLLLVLLALLRPTLYRRIDKPERAALVLLLDQSRSMELPHDRPQTTRWEVQRALLRRIDPALQRLQGMLDVRLYLYDRSIRPLERRDGKWLLPPKPEGAVTDVGGSLLEAVRDAASQPLVAVVLMGDGVQTAFDSDVDPFTAARELQAAGVPLYTIPWGPTGSTAQSRDVAVEQFPEQFRAFVKNELTVRGVIRVVGLANQEVPVKLLLTDRNGATREIAATKVVADTNAQSIPVEIPFVPEAIGTYRLTLRAEPAEGEPLLDNNQLTAFLTVREGGLRVLYLEGELRQEQKFIRWSLDASPDIELDFEWFPRTQQKRWPIRLGQRLADRDYDVFFLGDLPSKAVSDEDWAQLAALVGQGKGLLTMGGYRAYGLGQYHRTPLAKVLPIKMHRFTLDRFDTNIMKRWHFVEPVKMVPAMRHPVIQLGPWDRNDAIWEGLPPLKGANRFAGVKQLPGIQVLLRSPAGDPLLVAGEYDRGRVLAFAGDSTWQWWRRGRQERHRRFWRQVVLWLARRDASEEKEVWAELSQRRVLPGTELKLQAGVRTGTGEAVAEATLQATIVASDAPHKTLHHIPLARDGQGKFQSALPRMTRPGTYRVRVAARDGDRPIGETEIEFQVLDRDLELASYTADVDYLSRLAAQTAEAGGELITPQSLVERLASWEEEPPEVSEPTLERWTLGEHGPDAWLFLLMLVGLLTIEWVLRRRWGLV